MTSLTHSAINKTKKGSLNSWNLYFREKKMDDRQDESVNIWCVRCYKLLLRKGQITRVNKKRSEPGVKE